MSYRSASALKATAAIIGVATGLAFGCQVAAASTPAHGKELTLARGKELTLARAPLRGRIDPAEFGSGSSELDVQLIGRTLVVRGYIEFGFTSILAKYDFDVLIIDSLGGIVDEAIAAGRFLRKTGRSVLVDGECVSACVFVLAGGVVRSAEEDALIGVHRFFSLEPICDLETAQEKSAEIAQYLIEMDVSILLWLVMAKTPSTSMTYLKNEDLMAWNLLNPLVRVSGVDAPGNDFENMPIREIDEHECVLHCSKNSSCMAATYNKRYRACFLKTGIDRVEKAPDAITLHRPELSGSFTPKVSSLPAG